MSILKTFSSNLHKSNLHIKIISLILGYAFWSTIGQSHTTKIWLDAPICFYNIPKNNKISCKEKIKIQLFAKRSDLYTIDRDTLAFHIDVASLQNKSAIVKLEPEQLLLPESIKMANCYPESVAISVEAIKPVA